MTEQVTTDDSSIDSAASALSAGFDHHAPFGYYDHFNDTLYRGPLAWVAADEARIGGNKVTTLFDMSSADCLLARRVARIDDLAEALAACVASLRGYRREMNDGNACDAEKAAVILLGSNVVIQGPRSGPAGMEGSAA